MKTNEPYIINSISQLHWLLSLPAPEHPQVSIIDLKDVHSLRDKSVTSVVLNFYSVWLEKDVKGKIRYGQGYFDFDEGIMIFIAPHQVLSTLDHQQVNKGFGLIFHPDFIKGYPLARAIKDYGYFSYAVNEALHLSEKEEEIIVAIMHNIAREYCNNIDKYTQDLIISHIEVLLNYANRFYGRQFITRKSISNDMLARLDDLLNQYFDKHGIHKGLPSVNAVSEQLNVSAGYLSDLLRDLTGQNAQQHIHYRLIEKAKELLSMTSLSTAEIAFQLGFEYPQSFSRLFKQKTNLSPSAYRSSFN